MATVAAINELGSCALNPRGNLWYNDESSYGRKLLLKMGWKKGKGLGKNEDGIKENLKMKFRDTNSGLGYKDESSSNVMSTEYESILKDLSSKYQQPKTDGSGGGVEHKNKDFKKSRVVKSRIRYPKLYYGKDVSKYSEKDMKGIFICSLPSKENEELKPEDSESCCKKETENELPEKCETYNSQLSISDYFNLKMKGKEDNELKKKIDDEIKQEKTELECSKLENAVVPRKKRCKKRKKNSEMRMNGDAKNLLPLEAEDVIAPTKKRKQLSENSVSKLDSSDQKMWEMYKCAKNQSSVPSKKRKMSCPNESFCSASVSEEVQSCHSDLYPDTLLMPKKKKKLHTNMDGSVDTVELLSVNVPKDDLLADSLVVNNLSTSDSVQNTDENFSSNSIHCTKKNRKLKNKLKKLKSCLKSKNKKYSAKNVSFNENISYKVIDSDFDESTDSLSDCPDKLQNDVTSMPNSNCGQEDCGDNTPVVQDISLSEHNVNNDSGAPVSEEEIDSLSKLPRSNSSFYNSWVEEQKLALKMQIYKNMLKRIKKHEILKTTNLLSLKGYGNWGF